MLSVRMQAVADMVSPGSRLADIGTDHGFVPIELVRSGCCPCAIAADVRIGPLSHASANIAEYGLDDRIKTRLSDGLKNIRPGEADAVVIAGMGGMLMIRILEEGEETVRAVKELILQPQSDIPEVRKWLHKNDLCIIREQMVYDMGKYYFIMKAVNGKDVTYDEADDRYGRLLLEEGSEVLAAYLAAESEKYQSIRDGLNAQRTSEKGQRRLTEISDILKLNAAAMRKNEEALKRKGGVL